MDNQVHTLAAGEHNYSTYSLWDTYRACHPAFTLFQANRVPSLVNCLIAMAEQSPAGMPVWPLQAEETGTMTGYHSASVMAEACVKNFPGIDWERAYEVMRKRNMDDDYRGLALYRKDGYIPADLEDESVSKTLEYDYGDWACSHVAKKLGRNDDVAIQLPRSQNYQHLFDKQTLFIRAKLANGEWATPFDPKEMGHTPKYRDYTESNAWQTTFGIQHDVKGLIEQFGGREPFLNKLDELFNQSSGVARRRAAGYRRPHRPVRARQRALPPHRLSLRLGRPAVEDAGARPRDPRHALPQRPRWPRRQRRLRPDVRVVRHERARPLRRRPRQRHLRSRHAALREREGKPLPRGKTTHHRSEAHQPIAEICAVRRAQREDAQSPLGAPQRAGRTEPLSPSPWATSPTISSA